MCVDNCYHVTESALFREIYGMGSSASGEFGASGCARTMKIGGRVR